MSDIKILKAGENGENKLNVVYIYMLVDPLTNLVRYNVCNKENRTYYNYKWVKIN
jgi:hypothetical protein